MPKSRTKTKEHRRRKTNPVLVETINLAMQNPSWLVLARQLSGPTRRQPALSLAQINEQAKDGEVIVIPGKVLSQGELDKKVRISALSISETAKEKLKKSKSEFVPLIEEINKNKKAEGVKILSA